MRSLPTFFDRLHTDQRGAVMVSFILTLPVFWTIISIFVQLALLCTARLYVNHAAWMTARAAATALPEDQPDRVRRAAYVALAPLSPGSRATSTDSQRVAKALSATRLNHAGRFASRYSYAAGATQVTWSPSGSQFSDHDGDEMEVTVRYQFLLTVPIAAKILSPARSTVGGVSGRFLEISRTVRIERSPGRKSASSASIFEGKALDQ